MTPSLRPQLLAKLDLIRTLAAQQDPRLSIADISKRLEEEGVSVGRRVLSEFIADPGNLIQRSAYVPSKPRSDLTSQIAEMIEADRMAAVDGLSRLTNADIAAELSRRLGHEVTRQRVQNRVHALGLRTSEETRLQRSMSARSRGG